MRALILVGAPSHTEDAAVSATLRIYEVFTPDELVLAVSPFEAAERAAGEARRVAEGLGANVDVVRLERGVAARMIESLVGESGIVVPTAGSVAAASLASYYAGRLGKAVAHVLFPFGHWTGLRYPFVPRPLQPIVAMGVEAPREVPSDIRQGLAAMEPPKLPRIRREVALLARTFNVASPEPHVYAPGEPPRRVDARIEALHDSRDGRVVRIVRLVIDGVEVDRIEAASEARGVAMPRPAAKPATVGLNGVDVDSLRQVLGILAPRCGGEWGRLAQLHRWAGFEKPVFRGCARVVVDTNLLYQGVHNLAPEMGPALVVPYCAAVEVLNNRAEARNCVDRLLAEAASLALETARHYSSQIPTYPYKCDPAMPLTDPNLVDGACIASADRGAVEAWRGTVLSRVAHVVEPGFEEARAEDRVYAVAQLYALLRTAKEKLE